MLQMQRFGAIMKITDIHLFNHIQPRDLAQLLNCCEAKTIRYPKDAFVWLAGTPASHIGIVKHGQVNIIREDILGNRHIIGQIVPGQVFGETFACAGLSTYPVSVQVAEPSEIMLLALKKVIRQCPSSCSFHARLIENLMQIMAEKNLMLNQKISLLSYKQTRQKVAALLLSYMRSGEDTAVTLPFSREEMADYFGLNRSALSRELGKMRAEGILSYQKNRFWLKDLARLSALAHD